MSKSIFKGFKAHDGTKESDNLILEDGYIHFIRTDSNKENGYIYFNGKKYGNTSVIDAGEY